jgi:CRISPR-associated protein Cmr1
LATLYCHQFVANHQNKEMSMQKISVVLETITPLFLAGADPRGEPELRAPSVRGALRYWLRALLGGFAEFQTLANLQRQESKIFGSTDSKLGGASPITIKCPSLENEPQDISFRKQKALQVNGKYKPTGRDYLWWSMAESGRQGQDNHLDAKRYLPKGTRFEVTLQSRLANRNFSTELVHAGAALWCLVQFGALGARSRRAAGCFSASPIIGAERLPPFETPDSPQSLAQQLGEGLAKVRTELRSEMAGNVKKEFDILHPDSCQIWVVTGDNPWTSSDDAVEEIGARFRDFRGVKHYEPDHLDVRAWIQRDVPPPSNTVQRAVFGLPIEFRYSDHSQGDVLQGSVHERRASPLHLHVSRLLNNSFVGVITLFKSSFLERNEKLMLKKQSTKTTALPPNFDLAKEFVEQFPTFIPVTI